MVRFSQIVWLGLFFVMVGCASGGTPQPKLVIQPPPPRVVPPPPPVSAKPKPIKPVPKAVSGPDGWTFLDHAVTSCYPDKLVYSAYMKLYAPQMGGMKRLGLLKPGDPLPSPGFAHPKRGPEVGTSKHDEARQQWIEAWRDQQTQSHVMDCAFRFPWPAGTDTMSRAIPYAVYLPADYLQHPTRQRPLLVLFPGGRGNRTRWFLVPLTYRHNEKGSGGVQIRRRVDAWVEKNPDAATPIIVSINGPGVYGKDNDVRFLGELLPKHLLSVFLPNQTLENTPYGIETISSAGGIGVRTLFAYPNQVNSLGLNCLACDRAGLVADVHLGSREERSRVQKILAERKTQGVLDMRFSIGDRDHYLGCNRRLYREMLEVGFWTEEETSEFVDCTHGPSRWSKERRCVQSWPGFRLYPRIGHNYRLLYASIDQALDWNLDLLVGMLPKLKR